ncbi:penicillin-binding protein 2 [Beggiatoa leptomitoformis]|uniref:Peptidoglycan D,D-transpeptidase FtsI n=2 Tax=Beggiatoa leptomitoformis TaxID=288004 RepID=A0A2N9YJ52_9GAMM|nr:penicillin-binding protein 2 [Beggiatoa leptomitoformis]AUI70469.2 penicillin-binding protein 2 [Beggiatoa leptomitoformis]
MLLNTTMLLLTKSTRRHPRRTSNRFSPRAAVRFARRKAKIEVFWVRRQWMLSLFSILAGVLVCRAIYLQVMDSEFLQDQGDARHIRTVTMTAHRGMLMDRNGEPLAISSPVDSVWVNPSQFKTEQANWDKLATTLNINRKEIDDILTTRMSRGFVYLKRHISPEMTQQVKSLDLSGVYLQREYRRFYPSGEVTAHLLGFTNVDDSGQEGMELAFNNILRGVAGAKQVMQDNRGQIIADVENISLPQHGKDIRLSIDRRLQYLAYRELRNAVRRHNAVAGAAVILDVRTGEVLAMVNQPTYNPNDRSGLKADDYRNRAVVDLFEPGSTMKPFTIAAALQSGKFTPDTLINTSPGSMRFGKYLIHDTHNYGTLSLAKIIQKSSNVGASKIALSIPAEQHWRLLDQLGFGGMSASGFPGEIAGRLSNYKTWKPIQQASISYGYSINTTLLQLARAYTVLGNGGILPAISFTPVDTAQTTQPINTLTRVISPKTAREILDMLELVVKPGGTGTLAKVPGYRVGGKTGTALKSTGKGYSAGNYYALFVGIAPISTPRLVMAILIEEPRTGGYYGGQVAAPVFSKVMTGALRLLNIPPDDVESL